MMLSRETALAFLDEMEKIAGKRTDEVLHALTVSLRKPVTDEHRQAWTRHSALNLGMALAQAKQAITGVAYDGSKAVRKEEAKDALHSLAFTLMPPSHHKPGDLAGIAAKDGGHMDYLRYGAGDTLAPGGDHWRFLNARGRQTSFKSLKKAREAEIAAGERVDLPLETSDGPDWSTPFNQKESHLHKGGKDGIHFKGTLAEARAELAKAREGKSLLKTAAYSEGATSTFSHEKRRYSVDKAIAATQQKAVRQVPVKDLEWILKYTKPDAGRARAADTDVPVLATKYGDKLVVVDGLHRLAKARAEGRETLPVRYVARADLGKAFIEKKAAAESAEALYARSKETRAKALPVMRREQKRLRGLGFKNILPLGSISSGTNLPDEGVSDLDINVGVKDVAKASALYEEKTGVPFTEIKQNSWIHRHRSSEGFEVEVKFRPVHEIDYQRAGSKRMSAMSQEDKKAIVAEKYRLKNSGDRDAYRAYKWGVYEKYGVLPPGGDWSLVKKAVDARALKERLLRVKSLHVIDPRTAPPEEVSRVLRTGGAGHSAEEGARILSPEFFSKLNKQVVDHKMPGNSFVPTSTAEGGDAFFTHGAAHELAEGRLARQRARVQKKAEAMGWKFEKTAGRPIKDYKGLLRSRRWWFLNRKGNPASTRWLKEGRESEIASGEQVADAAGDWATPWYKGIQSHLHGDRAEEGIHFRGTLREAREELRKARNGSSGLPWHRMKEDVGSPGFDFYGKLPEVEKKAEYAKGLPDKKKTSPVRLVEKPEHWRMVTQSHPAQRSGQHTDLRLTDPAPGGISHSWATKKDWPKPGERIRLFQQPDHKPSYSDFQGHLLSGYGKTKPGSKGVQKVMDERVEIKRTSDKLIRFDVFRKEGELPDRYVLVKAKHDGKGHPPWVLINHGKAKADQVPVK